MAKSKKASGPPDPHTLRMAANARKELDRRSWSYEDLAPRIGRSVPQVKRLMNPRGPNGRRHWDAHDIFAVAGALGISVEDLDGGAPTGTTFWDPRIEQPSSLLNTFAEHQEHSPNVVAFNRIVPCSVMTPIIQHQHYLSLFAPFMSDPFDARFCRTYNDFASFRRETFLRNGSDAKLCATALMLRSDFERMVFRQPPFHQCSRQYVLQNLEHLRTECVQKRRFRLALISDVKVPPQLYPRISFDSVALVGDTLRVERRADFLVECSQNSARVDDAKATLSQLASLVDFEPGDFQTLTRELEHYMKQIEHDQDNLPAEP